MGVYIRGMEMPTCYTCQFESICGKWAKHDAEWQKENRDVDCPLVEIKPHGRLIDRDALTLFGQIVTRDAPTIIEAENQP